MKHNKARHKHILYSTLFKQSSIPSKLKPVFTQINMFLNNEQCCVTEFQLSSYTSWTVHRRRFVFTERKWAFSFLLHIKICFPYWVEECLTLFSLRFVFQDKIKCNLNKNTDYNQGKKWLRCKKIRKLVRLPDNLKLNYTYTYFPTYTNSAKLC